MFHFITKAKLSTTEKHSVFLQREKGYFYLPAQMKGESFVMSARDALSLMRFKDNSTFSVHHIGRFV